MPKFEDVYNDCCWAYTCGHRLYPTSLPTEAEKQFFTLPLLQFSDYSGGFVCQVNCEVVEKLCDEHSVEYRKQYCYGGYSLYLPNIDLPEEIVEALDSLYSYPCLDDEALSNLEHECKIEYLSGLYDADWNISEDDFVKMYYDKTEIEYLSAYCSEAEEYTEEC
jgi:hypothetical protein